jgi:hypothetical protein
MSRLRAILFVPVLSLAHLSHGWGDTGHMVIAEIARRHLNSEALAEAERLVRIGGNDRTSTFCTAACWADDTRSRESGPWHYINLHFRADGTPSENKPLEENAVWVIERFQKVLADRSKPDGERADALRYLLHFVGDLHQPLHAVARDTDRFPKGDRGGNDFAIEPPAGMAQSVRNLHSLWDAGAGLFPRVQRPVTPEGKQVIDNLADRLMREHPRERSEAWSVLEPMKWAEEGLELAKRVVYDLEEGRRPDRAYLDRAQAASAERSALAGYRLAELLNRALPRS